MRTNAANEDNPARGKIGSEKGPKLTIDSVDSLFSYELQRAAPLRIQYEGVNGSMTSDGGTRTFEWDGANRLVAINYTGFTTRSEFTYDGLSRVVKIVEKTGGTINSTRKFVWHGQEKLEFRDAADAVTLPLYAHGQFSGNKAYFYTRDHLGSIREMLGSTGTVVARYDYDPFGRSTTILATTPTDFNFTGLYRHSKSNLDLAVYRAYDPDLARWLNRDPLENAELSQGPNLYAYVGNNPVNRTDPLGLYYALAPWTWFDGNGYEGTGADFYRGSDFDQGAYAGLDGLIPFADPFSDHYDPCAEDTAISNSLGMVSQGALSTAVGSGLGPRAVHLLNHNRYLRIGPGRDGGTRVIRVAGKVVGIFKKDPHIVLKRLGPL